VTQFIATNVISSVTPKAAAYLKFDKLASETIRFLENAQDSSYVTNILTKVDNGTAHFLHFH
jgi:hypothetical protein